MKSLYQYIMELNEEATAASGAPAFGDCASPDNTMGMGDVCMSGDKMSDTVPFKQPKENKKKKYKKFTGEAKLKK